MFSGMSQRLSRLLPGMMTAVAVFVSLPLAAEAKSPGKTYCFSNVCHRVNTLQEMADLVGKDLNFKSSFYDDCKHDRLNPCGLTASGEVFRPNDADNAASPIYPEGTVILVRNPENGQSAVLRVNNAGPYWGKRKLDVSRGAAEKLGFKTRGVASLEVRVIAAPTKEEARYKKNRHYDAVPGPLGQFASLEAAAGGMMVAMARMPDRNAAAIRIASADQFSKAPGQDIDANSPAEGLKAEARREYGVGQGAKQFAPAILTAAVAPIHRSRQQYTLE